MKTLTLTSLIAAAAMTVAAGSASAESMKAEIPFTFQAGGALMGPGSYTVNFETTSGSTHIQLRNLDTRQGAMLVQSIGSTPLRKWRDDGRPRLGFECAGGRCALREVWRGGDTRSYHFNGPKLPSGDAARVAEVVLTKAN